MSKIPNKIMFLLSLATLIFLALTTSCINRNKFNKDQERTSSEVPHTRAPEGYADIFVDSQKSLTASSDGKSWATAFLSIQEAIDKAPNASHIYIASGTYLGPIVIKDKQNISLFGGCKAGNSCDRPSFDKKTASDGWTTIDGQKKSLNLVEITGKTKGIHFEGGFTFKNVGAGSAIEISGTEIMPIEGFTISDCNFVDNKDDRVDPNRGSGAGIAVDHAKDIKLKNIDASNNQVAGGGGFMAAQAVQGLSIEGGEWQENSGIMGGGALFVQNSSVIEIKGLKITDSYTSKMGGQGAGIRISKCTGKVLVDATDFAKNKAHTGGGLFIAQSENIELSHLKFLENRAHGCGGLSVTNSSNLLIKESNFVHNHGSPDIEASSGGGICLDRLSGKVELDKVILMANEATSGGGMYIGKLKNANLVEIKNSRFIENVSFQDLSAGVVMGGPAGGGALLADSMNFVLKFMDTTFQDNSAAGKGGALRLIGDKAVGSKFSVEIPHNVVFIKNQSKKDNGGGAIYVEFVSQDPAVNKISFWSENYDIYGNISKNNQGQFLSAKFLGGTPSFEKIKDILVTNSSGFSLKNPQQVYIGD